MNKSFRSWLILFLMLSTYALAVTIRPTTRIADKRPPVQLAKIIPEKFSDWNEIKHSTQAIVNPQEQEMLNALYSQTISKSYINSTGYIVMLSIAYGGDQSRDLQVHRPEVCYSAQGFQISGQEKVNLEIGAYHLPAMRLLTNLGSRNEPVTYWVRIGDKLVRGNLEQGFARMSYGIKGQIADGLLFRVSSIDGNAKFAYETQEKFVADLLNAIPELDLASLIGTS